MKYRIKQVGDIGFFGQVKRGFFSKWKTIGKHANDQYGEYPEDHLDHPLASEDAAYDILLGHQEFNRKKVVGNASYKDM